MKTITLILLLTGISFFVKAQKLNASEVPAAVRASFEKKYPGVAAKWEKEDRNFEVNFSQHSTAMSAVIDPAGNILETESDLKISELPASVSAYVKQHYPGKLVKEAAMITKANGVIEYEAEIADKDLIFDGKGKFVKEKNNNEEND